MGYQITDDEEYFLNQFLLKLERNQSVSEVPEVWMPEHFNANRFRGAYYKFCNEISPNSLKSVPHLDYYLSLNFTEAQSASIDAWIAWIRSNSKKKPSDSASKKSELEEQNRYYAEVRKRLEAISLEKRKKEQEKETFLRPAEDNWGRRAKKLKLEDDGNSWREQK